MLGGCSHKETMEANSDKGILCIDCKIVDNCPYEYKGIPDKVLRIVWSYSARSVEEAIAKHGKSGRVERDSSISCDAKIVCADHVLSLLQWPANDANLVCTWRPLAKDKKSFEMDFLSDGTPVSASGALPGAEGWIKFAFYPSGHIRTMSRPIEDRDDEYFVIRFSRNGNKKVFYQTHVVLRQGVDPAVETQKMEDFNLEVEELLSE